MHDLTEHSLSTHGVISEPSRIDHIGKGREGNRKGRPLSPSIVSLDRATHLRRISPPSAPRMDDRFAEGGR